LVVLEGTIYPMLSRLRKSDLLTTRQEESSSGPSRKYYRLTEAGFEIRDLMNLYWDELGVGVEELMRGKTEEKKYG
jgi:PadR family transcriptional regulator PadR